LKQLLINIGNSRLEAATWAFTKYLIKSEESLRGQANEIEFRLLTACVAVR